MASEQPKWNLSDLRRLLTGGSAGHSRERFAPAQVIYAQGDPGNAAFFVESGRVIITTVTPSGKEAVVGIRREDEFFGTRCLVGRRAGGATALTASTLVRVPVTTLRRLLREQPDFAVMFATFLVSQSISDQENLVDHLTNSAEKRLARTLLQLADRDASDASNGFHAVSTPINQAVLAKMIGTTRPRVSFFMNKFKRQGLIDYSRTGDLKVSKGLRRLLQEAS